MAVQGRLGFRSFKMTVENYHFTDVGVRELRIGRVSTFAVVSEKTYAGL